MSNQYAPSAPVSKDGGIKQNYPPPKTALATTNNENASASSVLNLSHNTTEIEVSAVSAPMAGKWISAAVISAGTATSVLTAAANANFDFVVQSNTTRRFVVPISTAGGTSGSVQGVNREQGLFPNIAYKIVGSTPGSVLTTEF